MVDVHGKRVFEGAWTGDLQVDWPAGWYTLRVGQGDGRNAKPSWSLNPPII